MSEATEEMICEHTELPAAWCAHCWPPKDMTWLKGLGADEDPDTDEE